MASKSDFSALKKTFEESIASLTALINKNRDELFEKIDELQIVRTELDVTRKEVKEQKTEIFTLKTKVNQFEQHDRLRSLRIFGLSIPAEDEEALGINRAVLKNVYNRIIKPILTVAKAKNASAAVPQADTALISGYRVGTPKKGGRASPLPCVITFNHKETRDLVMRHKRGNIPAPSPLEKEAGVKRLVIVEDLTPDTHRKLKEMVEHDSFAKVWTINGAIRFTLAEDPDGTIGKVDSPYLSIQQILAK